MDDLPRFTIGQGQPEPGFAIPRRPGDVNPRAGFVGDYRPLAVRLADPDAPRDVLPAGEHHLHAGRACAWVEGSCFDCGVGEDPCELCGGKGYHELACSESD